MDVQDLPVKSKELVKQIGWNMEVYIYDLPVKSKEPFQHLEYLREAFAVTIQNETKLG